MSIQQGYHVNVAKIRPPQGDWEIQQAKQEGEVFSMHYCDILIGDFWNDALANEMLIDIKRRFPSDEFVVSMTDWRLRGREIK